MAILELENVTKQFGELVAVDHLSLQVPSGSIYGFIGPNGSGKTTTLRMVMNIYRPDTGAIRVLGEPPGGKASDQVGYLPEERGLYRRMKVNDLLLFYAALRGRKDAGKEIEGWLERLGLVGCGNKKIETLSKGMMQKVQFLATVIARPELLILDEPFSGLDPVNTQVLESTILGLRNQGATVIFSTHDMNVAERLCDFVFMIFKGRKVLDGTMDEIQAEYGTDTVRIAVENPGVLRGLPGVEQVTDHGRVQELRLQPATDPSAILEWLVQRTRVQRFEIVHPSLQDIFLRIADPVGTERSTAEEGVHA